MMSRMPLRHLGRFLKLFVIGSFVATRTASGAATPGEALQHEMAWMSVRDDLATGTAKSIQLPAEVSRLAGQDFDGDFEARVKKSYLATAPADIAQLDLLWMISFEERAADIRTVDRFLLARSSALGQMMQDTSAEMNSPEKVRSFVRNFKREPYSG